VAWRHRLGAGRIHYEGVGLIDMKSRTGNYAKNVMRQVVDRFGYSISRNLPKETIGTTTGSRRAGLVADWDVPETFIVAFDGLEGICSSTWQGYFSIWQSVKYIQENEIPGAIVECGVELGAGLVTIGNALENFDSINRSVLGFDTFSGMSKPTKNDFMSDRMPAEKVMSQYPMRNGVRDFCYGSLEEVDAAIRLRTDYPRDNFHLVQGLVEETIPSFAPPQIALLRLDTDWYESTKHELEHLYPLLSPGGVLMIDDYGIWQGARKATDEYFEDRKQPLLTIDSPDRSRIGVKPQ